MHTCCAFYYIDRPIHQPNERTNEHISDIFLHTFFLFLHFWNYTTANCDPKKFVRLLIHLTRNLCLKTAKPIYKYDFIFFFFSKYCIMCALCAMFSDFFRSSLGFVVFRMISQTNCHPEIHFIRYYCAIFSFFSRRSILIRQTKIHLSFVN